MSKEFKLTDPGEGLHEAEILEVHVAAGDTVEDGDTVLTVETDKASTEVPAPFSGTVEDVMVSEGDTIEVGGVLMTYNDGEDEGSAEEDSAGEDSSEEGSEPADEDEADSEQEQGSEDTDESEQHSDSGEPAHEKNVEMGDIESSDEQDDERDDEQAGDDQSEEEPQQSTQSSNKQRSKEDGKSGQPVPAAPSTRRLAREKNVELGDIEPSGEHGRVTREDVERAAEQHAGDDKQRRAKDQNGGADDHGLIPVGGEPPALPDFSQWGEVERMALRSIRRATAQSMAVSWGQIPHVFHQDIADVTELERFRREHKDSAEAEGGKFTLTVLVIKALAAALKQFPRFNASLDIENQEIVLKKYCHIGLAVATDHGLLVPVIRDVDQKNLVELTVQTTEIARKTRNGEVSRDDMMGAGITVTNPGPMGGSSLTPLVNHPQVAILGMARARLEPVARGDIDNYEIKARLRLPLILGFDHRINDGADAAQFVTHMINTLADPESLLLDI